MCGKMKQQVAKDRIFKRTACTELGLSRVWGRNLCAKEWSGKMRGARREKTRAVLGLGELLEGSKHLRLCALLPRQPAQPH